MTEPIPTAADRHLAELARRLADDPAFMAYLLALYQAQEKLSAEALRQQLGLTPAAFSRLALCKRPASSAPEFATQVRQLADFTGAPAASLAQLIRQAEAIALWQSHPPPTTGEADAPRPAAAGLGWLAAARDRTEADTPEDAEDEAPPPPPGNA